MAYGWSENNISVQQLKEAAAQANEKLANGEITQQQYDSLQREIIATEQQLEKLEAQADKSAVALQKLAATGENMKQLGDKISGVGNTLTKTVMVQGSGDARMQPLYFLITTAGNNTESICYEVHQKAMDIMEGRKHDSTFYPVIFGAGVDEDWTDPKVWKKANPSLTSYNLRFGCVCNSSNITPCVLNPCLLETSAEST